MLESFRNNRDIYNLLAAKNGQEELDLQNFSHGHDCEDENPAINESLNTTHTSIFQRHRCLIGVIIFLVISSIAATLAVVMVPRTSGTL